MTRTVGLIWTIKDTIDSLVINVNSSNSDDSSSSGSPSVLR